MIRRAAAVLLALLLLAPAAARADKGAGEDAYNRADFATALKELRPVAEAGDAHAQYLVGVMYRDGQGVTADPAEALSWFRKAADQGHADAQASVGWAYENAGGVGEDLAEAARWYRLAADQGSAFGQAALGGMMERGRGMPRDDAGAAKLFKLAADQGHPWALYRLADMHASGRGVARDLVESERLYRLAIEKGNLPEAMNGLAWMLVTGDRDLPEAYDLASRAAKALPEDAGVLDTLGLVELKRGNGQAAVEALEKAAAGWPDYGPIQDRLGDAYAAVGKTAEARQRWQRALELTRAGEEAEAGWDRAKVETKLAQSETPTQQGETPTQQAETTTPEQGGTTAEQGETPAAPGGLIAPAAETEAGIAAYDAGDYAAAMAKLKPGAEAGDPVAQYYLGVLYRDGLGTAADPAEGLRWLRKAADQGHADAQANVGWAYETGTGVAEDPAEAARFYKLAADQGSPFGQAGLANLMLDGRGLPRDEAGAAKLFQQAAEQGHAWAAYRLANLYAVGVGVAADSKEAERLYRLALEKDSLPDAMNGLAWLLVTEDRNLAEAYDLAIRAASALPDNSAVLDTLGYIELKRGNPEAAVKALEKAVSLWDKYAPHFDRLGDAYAALGRSAEARRSWQRALELTQPGEQVEPGWDRAKVEAKLAQAETTPPAQSGTGTAAGTPAVPTSEETTAGLAAFDAGDYATAMQKLQPAAEAGDAQAQYYVGIMHRDALGTAADPAEALRWFRKGADQGLARAQSAAGYAYETGSGVAADPAEAARYYGLAAEQGDTFGLTGLASLMLAGSGIEKNEAEAAKLFAKAAELGDSWGMSRLATLYASGTGVPRDPKEAERLYRQAIESGNVADAMNGLAWLLAEQDRNLPEAYDYAVRAARELPEDAATLDTLGWIALKRGDAERALAPLEKAARLWSDYAPIQDRLGDVYKALGRPEDARARWAKALELSKPGEDVERGWDRARVEAKLAETAPADGTPEAEAEPQPGPPTAEAMAAWTTGTATSREMFPQLIGDWREGPQTDCKSFYRFEQKAFFRQFDEQNQKMQLLDLAIRNGAFIELAMREVAPGADTPKQTLVFLAMDDPNTLRILEVVLDGRSEAMLGDPMVLKRCVPVIAAEADSALQQALLRLLKQARASGVHELDKIQEAQLTPLTSCLAAALAGLAEEERKALIEAQEFEPAFDRLDKVTQSDRALQEAGRTCVEQAMKASAG